MDISEELKRKKNEEASQIWVGMAPSAEQCKTCIFALEDTEYTVGAEMSYCDVYEPPDGKPMDVLWDKTSCEWHVENI